MLAPSILPRPASMSVPTIFHHVHRKPLPRTVYTRRSPERDNTELKILRTRGIFLFTVAALARVRCGKTRQSCSLEMRGIFNHRGFIKWIRIVVHVTPLEGRTDRDRRMVYSYVLPMASNRGWKLAWVSAASSTRIAAGNNRLTARRRLSGGIGFSSVNAATCARAHALPASVRKASGAGYMHWPPSMPLMISSSTPCTVERPGCTC